MHKKQLFPSPFLRLEMLGGRREEEVSLLDVRVSPSSSRRTWAFRTADRPPWGFTPGLLGQFLPWKLGELGQTSVGGEKRCPIPSA